MKPTSLHPIRRSHLKTTTVLPIALGAGVAALAVSFADGSITLRLAGAAPVVSSPSLVPDAVARGVQPVACNPCNPCSPCAAANPCNPCAAVKQPCNPCNPCAAGNPCNPCAAGNPCNPCAAANPCIPCNPCAAANPCSPCAAANPCNPCNPCAAAAGGATECVVPRLQTAAANPCNPCNPCAAGNPCNPCAAANPCNPCAAANPCNPCAAANPCNPCAAANPCNPCAAGNPCNPCNPCGAAGAVELTDAEAANVYDCVRQYMEAAYRPADDPAASNFLSWTNFSLVPYVSATHGNRYVMNYANPTAADAYDEFEDIDEVPAGGVIAKNSFVIGKNGQAMVGPLFLMEKMGEGFDAQTGDWKYSMIMADGSTFGVTNGTNSSGVQFCNECHAAVAEQDYLYFLPEDYRARKG